jgi:hypothetical protein
MDRFHSYEHRFYHSLSSTMSEEDFLGISEWVARFGNSPGDFSIELQALLDMYPNLLVWWRWNVGFLACSLLFSMETASTTSLRIGMYPHVCRKGDMVVLLYGCSWPVAIRAVEGREEQFEILGSVQMRTDLEADEISDCQEREFSFV